MPKGQKITENPDVERYVIALIQKRFVYQDIIKKVKEKFHVSLSLGLVSGYVRNYLPVEVKIPKKSRKVDLKSIEDRILPLDKRDYEVDIEVLKERMDDIDEHHIGEWLIDGENILNFYASRISRLEVFLDEFLKRKSLSDDEAKSFVSFMSLQDKLYQRIINLYMENKRRKEIYEIGWKISDFIIDLFFKDVREGDEAVYQKKLSKFKIGICRILSPYLGEEAKI